MNLDDQFGFLRQVSREGRCALESAVVSHRVGPKTRLIERDDEVSGIYLVQEGALRVFYLTPEGREGTLYWVDAGDSCILALNCVFGRMRYPAWVESENVPTRFSVIPGSTYRELFRKEAAIQDFSFAILSQKTFDLMTLLTEAQSLGLERRVAAFLLRRCDASKQVSMSQEVVANHLGTAREVVSRILRSFVAQDLIETRRGMIRILDETRLHDFL